MARRKTNKPDPTSPKGEKNIHEEHADRRTLLMESGEKACFLALFLYGACQYFVYYNGLGENRICSYQKEFTYSETSKFVSLLAFLAFGIG